MTQEETIIAAFFILECEPGCSEEDVKSSYRQLVRVWHPDRFETDQKLKQKATDKMKLLNEAYQLLLRCFEAQRQQSESSEPKHTKAQPETSFSGTTEQKTESQDGNGTVKITKKRNSETGQNYYVKVVSAVTGKSNGGRLVSTTEEIYKTRPTTVDESFEVAASHSMSFRLDVNQSVGANKLDIGSPLRADERQGFGTEYVFSDGSSLTKMSLTTDTWFGDDNKKAAYGRTSTSLSGLQESHQVFRKNRDWKSCVEVAQRAVDLHGRDSWGWIQRSFALHCQKRTREAFEALIPAIKLFPENITVFYNLACYAAQLGDKDGAKHWLDLVFNLAEKAGAYSGTFERYRKMALEDSDLVSVRGAIPQPPVSWKFRKYFGV